MKKELLPSSIYQFLFKYLRPFKLEVIISLLSILIISLSVLSLGMVIRSFINNGFIAHNHNNLVISTLMMSALSLVLAVASYFRSRNVNYICQKIENNIRKDIFYKLLYLSPSYFEFNKVGDLIGRVNNDLNLFSNSLVLTASFALRNLIMTLGGIILILYTDLKLTLLVLAILPVLYIPLKFFGKAIKQISQSNQKKVAEVNSYIEEQLHYIKALNAFNHQLQSFKSFLKMNDVLNEANFARIKLRSLMFAIIIGLILLSVSAVIWFGGLQVLQGKLSSGALFSFVFYTILVATSMGSLSEVYADWQRALGALSRIVEINNAQSEVCNPINPQKILGSLAIDFNQVSFNYPTRNNLAVLKDVNFTINFGSFTAIIGPSGSGKSSILQLILRLYNINQGEINLAGINLTKLNLNDLRGNFTYITQEPVIFSGTFLDNLLFGKEDATLEQIKAACFKAKILDFIESLPEKFATFIGEKGVAISGGQKQRIAIARAFLLDAPILLLDEATNALDLENEQAIIASIKLERLGKTTVIVTHRLYNVVEANQIILMNQGKVEAQGRHQDLIINNIIYQKLYHEL